MTSPKSYDAILLGSGQGSTPLTTALASAGYKTLLIEKTHIGGTCVNEGCTPTKTMITSGRIAYLAKRASDYGVNVDFKGIDMEKVRQRKRDIVESFRGGGERKLEGVENVEVLKGEGIFVGSKTLKVRLEEGEEVVVKAEKWVLISVGERPAIPRLEGLDEAIKNVPGRILNSTTIMELGEVPESLVVLGGGYVGLEFAQLFARLGAEVHVIQRGKQLLPREDLEVVEVLQDLLREEDLKIHLQSEAVSISHDGGPEPLTLKVQSGIKGGTENIKCSHVLLAAGRVPNTDNLDLSTAGVETDKRGYIVVNSLLETSAPGIYAMGDCKGPPAFTHISYDDFRILRDNLGLLPNPSSAALDKPPSPHITETRKPQIPYVCYTDPQLAHVGLHLSEIPMLERGDIQVAKMPMAWVARGLETDEPRGIMKVIVNGKSGQILGFSCMAPEGGEMMSVMQVAMAGNLKWWQLREFVFAHPSWAESLNNLWGLLEDAPKE